MKLPTVIGLAVAAGVLVAGTVVITVSRTSEVPVARRDEPVFPGLKNKLDDIAKITVTNSVRTLTIHKSGETWTLAEYADYPVRMARVRESLIGLANLEYYEPKTKRPELYSRLELEDLDKEKSRVRVVALYDSNGKKVVEFFAGKHRYDLPGLKNQGLYIRLPGEPATWLARGAYDAIEDPMRWLDRTIADIPSNHWRRIVLTGPKGKEVIVVRDEKEKSDFRVANAPKGKKIEGGWSVNVIGAVLTGLELENVKRADDVDFENNPVWRAHFEGWDGLVVDLVMADVKTDYWAKVEASTLADATDEAKKKADEINARTRGWAYELVSYKVTPIKTDMAELVAEAEKSEKSETKK